MQYTEAIAEIQKSELTNKEDIVDSLNENFKTLQGYKDTNNKLNAQLGALLEAAQAEGDEVSDKLKSAVEKYQGYAKQLEDKDKKITELETESSKLNRQLQLEKVTAASGVNGAVLSKLISEQDTLEVKEDKALVNGKDIKEWAKESHVAFMPALFQESETTPLSTGGANTNPPDQKSRIDTFHKATNWG